MHNNAIELPRDQYAHPQAPTEWWWHIGTLQAGDRIFGFEATLSGHSQAQGATPPIMFSEIMITDVANQAHYQKTTGTLYDSNYAESDPSKPWYAKYAGENGDGAISMHSPADDVYSISLQASIKDPQHPRR